MRLCDHGFVARVDRWRHLRGHLHDGMHLLNDLAVENCGEPHQHVRSTGRTLYGAVTDRIAILAKISRLQWNMLKHWGCHVFHPVYPGDLDPIVPGKRERGIP